MTAVAICIAGITLFVLYQAAFEQQRARLVEVAQSRARMMEAVARFHARYSSGGVPGGAFVAMLEQIKDAHKHFKGFGGTGEFALARREGENIVFLLSHRHHDQQNPKPVSFASNLAEPMRRALLQQSGTMVGLDYRGAIVLAAHEPVAELNLGIVAKIDLAEIRAPFINAGLLAVGSALVLIFLGTLLFRRVTNPLIHRLEESEQKYRTLFESARDGVCLMSDMFEECNEQVCRMWACTRQDIIGHSLLEFLPPTQPDGRDSADAVTARIDAAQSGTPQFFSWQLRRQDSVLIDADISLKAVEVGNSHDGKMLLMTVRDITDYTRAEAEREVLFGELEAKNAELERFTYTVSHDLKSPLITINGFLGLLEQDATAGDAARMQGDITQIRTATETMRRLLDELLELSRIGRVINPPQAVPLADLVHEAVNLVAGQIAARGVQVTKAPDLPVVYGDRPRLLEVLQNLLDNAVKFLGAQPEPRVDIGSWQEGDDTVCYVRDNGVGIEPRYHEKVFGLFEKLDLENADTGIGLALVKRIIEVHGGRIWVESKGAGQGSTFYFTLPSQGAAAHYDQ
jgi:PAS domain S-box-containing protein